MRKFKKIKSILLISTILSTTSISYNANAVDWAKLVTSGIKFAGAATAFATPIIKFLQSTELNGPFTALINAGGEVLSAIFSSGDEMDNNILNNNNYQIWSNATYSDQKSKKSKNNKNHSLRVYAGALMPISEDTMIGSRLIYVNARSQTSLRNRTASERAGLGFDLKSHLTDNLVFETSLRSSNGSIQHKAFFDIPGEIDTDNFLFKGKQKVNRLLFDNKIQYFFPLTDTFIVKPQISMNFFRQFSSNYYAFDPAKTCATINAKPSSNIIGDISLAAEKLLLQNDLISFKSHFVIGVSKEVFKYGKEYLVSFTKVTGEKMQSIIPFDKKLNSSFNIGGGSSITSTSRLYEVSAFYLYSNTKDNYTHQGILGLKINF